MHHDDVAQSPKCSDVSHIFIYANSHFFPISFTPLLHSLISVFFVSETKNRRGNQLNEREPSIREHRSGLLDPRLGIDSGLSVLGGGATWIRGGGTRSWCGRMAGQACAVITFASWDPPYMCRGSQTLSLLHLFLLINCSTMHPDYNIRVEMIRPSSSFLENGFLKCFVCQSHEPFSKSTFIYCLQGDKLISPLVILTRGCVS